MAKGDRDITVVRKPHRDKLSTASGTETVVGEISDVAILPRQVLENDRGWVTIEGYDIWVVDNSVGYESGMILSSDFIRIDGVDWQVDGPPAEFTKKGELKGVKIQVKKVGVA